jgi:hypothetical protein
MKKILLLATSLFVLSTNAASACSCLPTTPQQSLKNSGTVFAGRVIDVVDEGETRPEVSRPLLGFKVTFEVSNVWKGQPNRQFVVRTSGSSASCGYSFEKGKEYLVYASNQGSQLETGLCSGTKPLANAQRDLAVLGLGRGKTPTPQSSNPAQQLQRSKQLWTKQNISNYRFTLRRSCFCSFETRQPVKIEVRNGQVTSIVPAMNGVPFNREDFTSNDSIAKLFDVVEDAIARKAHRLSVTYHPTLGYPTKIDIDYDQRMADEELSITIENLQALKNR